MEEKWSTIEEFPTYSVSNYGEVLNQTTYKLMKQSLTQAGVVKVGLVMGGRQYTRSVKILVAEAFVHRRQEAFDTPVHLDGNQLNNRADNLVWRPRWFAWKYTRQFTDTHNHERGPIHELSSGTWYNTALDAAMMNGLLVKDIIKSVATATPTFPTGQLFSFR